MLMNASGHLQVTVVDGTTLTGIFAADGSLNVFDATNETGFVGLQHPCGAINCVSSSGTTLTGAQAPNGAYYVVNDSAEIGLRHSSGGLCVTGFTTMEAVSFLSTWGPYGMVMDFTDASIAIKEASGVLDFTSQGQISNGALIGPGAKLTYSGPSAKLTEQVDGFLKFQAHNLFLWSEDFSNAAWAKDGVNVSGSIVTPAATTGLHRLISSATITTVGPLSTSIYAAPAGYSKIAIREATTTGAYVAFDVSSGTILDSGLGGSGTIEASGSGYKCTIACTINANTRFDIIVLPPSYTTGSVIGTWLADGVSGIVVNSAHWRRTPSVNTYIATTSAAAYDLPYVYSGGDLQGIMVEAPATNLMPVATPSSGHSNITWAGNTLETLDPAGTNTASKMTTTATAGTNIVDSATVTATSCTASVYIKATTSGLNRFALRNATTATILLDITISDFSTGSFSYNTGSAGASVEVLNNGWLRVVLSASAGITSGNSIQFYTGALGNSIAAGQVLYIWCRQLETGTVATSPIITYGAAVARAADLPSVSTAAFGYGAGGGTIFVEYALDAFVSNPRVVALDNGALTEIHLIDHTGGTVARAFTNDGGVNQALISGTVNALGTPNKVAYAWASNDFAFVCNGTVSGTDASGTLPTPTTLVLGSGAGTNPMTGSIVRVAYFSRRLSNAELQEITT